MAQLILKVKAIKESPRKLKNYPKPLYPEIPPLTLVRILPTSSAYSQSKIKIISEIYIIIHDFLK